MMHLFSKLADVMMAQAPRRGTFWQCSVLLALLAARGPADPVVSDSLSPEQVAVLSALVTQVAEVRSLEPREPIHADVMSVDDLRGVLLREISEEYSLAQAEGASIAGQTVGILPPGYDLLAGMRGILTEQIGGLFDEETDRLYILSWINLQSQMARIILAHEITHALQDQAFDLSTSPIQIHDNDDRAIAALAVIEGDATAAMAQWAAGQINFGFVFEIAQMATMDQQALLAAPQALQQQLVFPYLRGEAYVLQVLTQRGQAAVDRLFSVWPESTEQLLHPERSAALGTADPPTDVTLDAAAWGVPEAWERLESNVFGEFGTLQIFQQSRRRRDAATLAEGWDGDRYEVWRGPASGETAVLWSSVWDSEADAAEFAEAIRGVLSGVNLTRARTPSGEAVYGEPAIALGRRGTAVHVAVYDRSRGLRLETPLNSGYEETGAETPAPGKVTGRREAPPQT